MSYNESISNVDDVSHYTPANFDFDAEELADTVIRRDDIFLGETEREIVSSYRRSMSEVKSMIQFT